MAFPSQGLPLGYSYLVGQIAFHESPQSDFYGDAKSVTDAEVYAYYREFGQRATSLGSRYEVVSRVCAALDRALYRYSTDADGRPQQAEPLFAADGMANLVTWMRSVFLAQGYLPVDREWTAREMRDGSLDPSSVLPPLGQGSYDFFNSDGKRIDGSGGTRIVWFYNTDLSQVDSDGHVKSAGAGRSQSGNNYFFSRGFMAMACDPDSGAWYAANVKGSDEGFFRQWGQSGDPLKGWPVAPAVIAVDNSIGALAEKNAEQIIDVGIVVVELTVNAFTAGAAQGFFTAINPLLFAMVHAMASGDASQLLGAIWSLAGKFADQIKLNDTALLQAAAKSAPKLYDFYNTVYTAVEKEGKQILAAVEGVGATIGGVADRAQSFIVEELKQSGVIPKAASAEQALSLLVTSIDPKTGKAFNSGLALGRTMLTATYERAVMGVTKVVTDDVTQVVRSTTGVLGWAHDIGTLIDFEKVAKKVPAELFPKLVSQGEKQVLQNVDVLKEAMHVELQKLFSSNNIPPYAEEAVFIGASFKLLATVQQGKFQPEPVFRKYQQNVTKYVEGYVPPELQAAQGQKQQAESEAQSKQAAKLAGLPPSVALAKIVGNTVSPSISVPSNAQIKAANRGVTTSDIGASPTTLAVTLVGSAAALALAPKALGKSLPPAAVAIGAVTVTALVWYARKGKIKGSPIVAPAVTFNPADFGVTGSPASPEAPTKLDQVRAISQRPVFMVKR